MKHCAIWSDAHHRNSIESLERAHARQRHRRHGACIFEVRLRNGSRSHSNIIKEMNMQWTTPAFTDLRFGFEITMYIATR
jgi:coenzyme PQQ precursor peptide PqqA